MDAKKERAQAMSQSKPSVSHQELYWRYKTATELVLRYLHLTASKLGFVFDAQDTMSRDEMVRAARMIASKGVESPTEVFWAIQSSIADRLEVTLLYQEKNGQPDDEASRHNHKHFVNVLSKLRKILFTNLWKAKQQQSPCKVTRGGTPNVQKSGDDQDEAENDDVEDEDELTEQDNEDRYGKKVDHTDMASFTDKIACAGGEKGKPQEISALDDQDMHRVMGWLYMHNMLKDMHDTKGLNAIWDDHEAGVSSLFEAGYLTNHIYESKISVFCDITRILNLTDVDSFWRGVQSSRQATRRKYGPEDRQMYTSLDISQSVRETFNYIKAYSDPERPEGLPDAIVTTGSINSGPAATPNVTSAVLSAIMQSRKSVANAMIQGALQDTDDEAALEARVFTRKGRFYYQFGFQRRDLHDTCSGEDRPRSHCQTGRHIAAITGLSWSVDYLRKHPSLASDLVLDDAVIANNHLQTQVMAYLNEILAACKDTLKAFEVYYSAKKKKKKGRSKSAKTEGKSNSTEKKSSLNRHTNWELQQGIQLLTAIAKRSLTDLYHLTPWVNGSRLVGIWMYAFSTGVRICNEGGFMTVVLHLYSAIVTSLVLSRDRLPVLEAICAIFVGSEGVFKGSRPTFNFQSNFCHALGGHYQGAKRTNEKLTRLHTNWKTAKDQSAQKYQEYKYHVSTVKRNKNGMTLPEHLPCLDFECKCCPDYTFITAESLSSAFLIGAENSFRPSYSQLAILKGYGTTPAAVKKAEDEVHAYNMNGLTHIGVSLKDEKETELLREMLRSEYNSGDLPVIRVNWIMVAKLCMQVLGRLGDWDDDEPKHVDPPTEGMFRASWAMWEMDKRALGYHPSSKYTSKAKEILLEIFEGLRFEDLLWREF